MFSENSIILVLFKELSYIYYGEDEKNIDRDTFIDYGIEEGDIVTMAINFDDHSI